MTPRVQRGRNPCLRCHEPLPAFTGASIRCPHCDHINVYRVRLRTWTERPGVLWAERILKSSAILLTPAGFAWAAFWPHTSRWDGGGIVEDNARTAVDGSGVTTSSAAALAPPYPNPFNALTRVSFTVERPARVRLRVHNSLGQVVRTLVDADRPAGRFAVTWDGRDDDGADAASGAYVVRLRVAGVSHVPTRVVALLR